jgi:peroxiredoxin
VWKIVEAPAMPWAWFGAVAAIAPFVLFLLSLAVVRRARTGRNQVALLVTSMVGTLVSLLSYESPASWLALFLGLVPSLAYVFWYSKLDRSRSVGLSVGATLPELDLVDAEGNPVAPTPGKHALYMFVRGNWCPLCMAQVKEIASEYRELEARGVEVFVITPQPEKKTRALANRFDVPMRFCVDEGNRVARKLGIDHQEGVAFGIDALGYDPETVLPTVLITDPNRTLIFADLTDNYRVRPAPSTFLAALDAHA